MQLKGKAKFLHSYVQDLKVKNSDGIETGEVKKYYKITLFTEDGFDKSPNLSVREDKFIELDLANPEVQNNLRNVDLCEITCELGFYQNQAMLNVVDIKALKNIDIKK